MNFFCSSAEFDEYVTEMELDPNDVIKADIDRALNNLFIFLLIHLKYLKCNFFIALQIIWTFIINGKINDI